MNNGPVNIPLLFFPGVGRYCSRTWDGWLCWDDTPADTYASRNCPDYFGDFDPTGEQRHSRGFAHLINLQYLNI